MASARRRFWAAGWRRPPSLEHYRRPATRSGLIVLRRELGRGGFARVFLAEQTNLENRLVVLKVSTRMTREPWLLARVRHAHIVEIVSHAGSTTTRSS